MTRQEKSIGYLTNWGARLFARALDRRLAGASAGPMPVFYALADGGRLTQTVLARLAAVEQPTMAKTLARMQRDGLLASFPDPDDRRSSLLALTELGLERAQAALAATLVVNEIALTGFSADERELFLSMLRKVVSRLEADGDA